MMPSINTIHQGDCLEVLRSWPDEFVQCVVTSPPYWGLRDYLVDGQLGLEPTVEEHVAAMVEIFREVRRVLRPDGTLWLNYGDSYFSTQNSNRNGAGNSTIGGKVRGGGEYQTQKRASDTLKPKDLCGVPWRVALALQADGWWLRQDIIWHKPNPMPGSATDRCTVAHEYIFLLTKSARYLYDADAIREKTGRECDPQEYSKLDGHLAPHGNLQSGVNSGFGGKGDSAAHPAGRNKRSVWTAATSGFKGAHFSTFPPKLIEPCILAGSKQGDLVLDPFMGAGTTAMVAKGFARDYIGTELNPESIDMANKRIANTERGLFG